MSDTTAHAIIVPWPVSEGIRTWCGIDAVDERVRNDPVATHPNEVSCPSCAAAMRRAHRNLKRWVPLLDEASDA